MITTLLVSLTLTLSPPDLPGVGTIDPDKGKKQHNGFFHRLFQKKQKAPTSGRPGHNVRKGKKRGREDSRIKK